jgi:hypothetical protein
MIQKVIKMIQKMIKMIHKMIHKTIHKVMLMTINNTIKKAKNTITKIVNQLKIINKANQIMRYQANKAYQLKQLLTNNI